MDAAKYSVVPFDGQWGVAHDGETAGPYVTREAAFEAAVAPASLAIKQGHAVEIVVAPPRPAQSPN